jgi:hypothetical protein
VSLPPLPNAWNLYNLASSPFFQGTLERREPSQRPFSLFGGREEELQRLRARVHGAGRGSSRQAVAGMSGVGKTTLVQEFKTGARPTGQQRAATPWRDRGSAGRLRHFARWSSSVVPKM